MEVFDAVRTRLTVREFDSSPVPRDVIEGILHAGRLAPSSRNRQPWHFIVITERATLERIGGIATSGRFVARAPMAIAVAMEDADRPDLDAGRAIQQMELVAWSEGLGTCFVGLRDQAQNAAIKNLLGIPENVQLITVLPFGYRVDADRGRQGVKNRKGLSEVAHRERFSAPWGR